MGFLSDNVRYPAQQISFNENKKTSDGKFLIPDCMAVENVKRTKYTDLSDIIETSHKFVSKTSKSMKIGGSLNIGVVSIGGSYSKDFFEMIEEQKNSSTVTARTKYYDHRYTLLTNSRCTLDNKFVQAVNDLIFAIDYNIPELVEYLAESIVADYGTHFVRKVNIGGTIYADDYLNEEYWHKMKETIKTVQTSASIGFSIDYIQFSTSFSSSSSVSSSDYSSFKSSIKRTFIDAVGGAYMPGMSVTKWAETLDNNMVTIDREVDLLNNLVLFSNFPDQSALSVYKASIHIKNAISKYLKENTVTGCLDRSSVNFEPLANYDPGNLCNEKIKFGGIIFKSCNENNILTGLSVCPSGYSEKIISSLDSSIRFVECLGNDFIKQSAVFFAGGYSSTANNPITNSKSCPKNFKAQKVFDCSSSFICVSTDEALVSSAIPFGGFVSQCFTNIENKCLDGFEKQFLTYLNGCEISYCTKLKRTVLPRLNKPPFVPKPPSYRLLSERHK